MIPKISIVITTHGKCQGLNSILDNILSQRKNVLGVHSVTGEKNCKWALGDKCDYPVEIIICSDGTVDPKLKSALKSWCKFIECPKEGGVGHHTRAPGIEAATGDYVVLTNSDNFFVLGWLHRIISNIKYSTGIIYWDCVNNLWGWTHGSGSRLRRGGIDLCCAAIKTSIAKEVGFPFRNYDGDWDYIAACLKLCNDREYAVTYLPEILTIHN